MFVANASQDDTDIVIYHERSVTNIDSFGFHNTRETTADNRDESSQMCRDYRGYRDKHDIMFSARTLRSVEEAIIINVKRYEVHIEWHRLIDVIGRLSCSITPSHDIGPRYHFHECPLHIPNSFSRIGLSTSEEIRAWFSLSLTCILRHTNSTDIRYQYSLTMKLTLDLYFMHICSP